MAEIKFCGLTRPEDAALAAALGASWAGVILAPSPREVSLARATRVLEALGAARGPGVPRRVGVFVSPSVDDLGLAVEALGLDAVQLHGAWPLPPTELRGRLRVQLWGVSAVDAGGDVTDAADVAAGIDVLLFDTKVAGRTGGSGQAFDWTRARSGIEHLRARARVAVAGGLHPGNVAEAIRSLAPDIVDVSSGVEASPGVKDPARMTAFALAVRSLDPA